MQTSIRHGILAATLVALLPITVQAQSPSPVMEFSSVLTSLDVYHHDGRLQLEDDNAALSTAFLAAGAKFDVVITAAGSKKALHIQSMSVSRPMAVFNRVEVRGNVKEFKFTEPGDYVATYRANRKPMTIVPFSIEFAGNDDEFDPKGQVRHGSFKLLEGDELLAVFATDETNLPTKFTSTSLNQQILAGYRRVQ